MMLVILNDVSGDVNLFFPTGLMLFSKETHGVNDCISCLELLTLLTYPFNHTWKYFIGKDKNKKKTSILGIQKTKVEIIW